MADETPPPPPILASDAERERTSEVLRQASVEGRLTLDEFSQRVEQALAARTRNELQAVTRDLPAIAPTRSLQPGGDAIARKPVRTSVSIMSGVERKGFWRVDEESAAISVMGSCKLDLRGAAISAPVTTINAFAMMGAVDVIVPFGVEVELEGIAIMGSKEAKLVGPPPAPGAPVVRVNAFALMGSVIVRDKPNLGERLRQAIEDRLNREPS
jgi:Domain of unknown function (DUF1707)/Cell wall-active antibiotics response 4TMS YvqF